MLNLYPRLTASPTHDDYRICYGILVACVSLLLFCVLVASVSIIKACAITCMIMVFFGVIGCFVPSTMDATGRLNSTGNSTQQATTAGALTVQRVRCMCGLAEAAINVLPTFAYECPLKSDSTSGSCTLCSVCLEIIQGGDMVRQLPVCKHLFHVECIDMWLHSHKTCPLCRCDLSPPIITVKAAAAAATESSADALPPV